MLLATAVLCATTLNRDISVLSTTKRNKITEANVEKYVIKTVRSHYVVAFLHHSQLFGAHPKMQREIRSQLICVIATDCI